MCLSQIHHAWRNFFLKTGKRRWRGSTPVNCWQKSKVGLRATARAPSCVNKSLIPIRHTLSMGCIISDTALYSEIKQRPLAALLIHFSPRLSFVGMPDSVQSAVFKIPAHLDPFGASMCLSAGYSCCPVRWPRAPCCSSLAHAGASLPLLVIVGPRACSM